MFGNILKGCGALSLLGVGLIIAIGVIGAIVSTPSGTSSGSDGNGSTSGSSGSEPDQQESEEPLPLVVRITGTPGLPVSGNLGNSQGGNSFEGTIPESGTFENEIYEDTTNIGFDVVTVVAQKMQAEGELSVALVRGEEIVAERSTSASYGAVNVSWTP